MAYWTRTATCIVVITALSCGSAILQANPTESPTVDPPSGAASSAETAQSTDAPLALNQPSYLISSDRITSDQEVLWPGFLHGMRDFDSFANPVGNPFYFESPFINSELRFIYMWHKFTDRSGNGDLNAFAIQARLALTDRLAFLATKDGYSRLRNGALPEEDGWNDGAIGLKYAFFVDKESQMVATGGMRWEWHNGDDDVLMGKDDELSPFLSFAKGWDRFHMLFNLTSRLPMNRHDGNYVLSYDLHFDYEVAPEYLPGFLPLVEFHGLHYLSDGDRTAAGFGGLDYTNLGSTHVAGNSVFWCTIGWEWKLTKHLSWGAGYEFPLHTTETDIFDQRVTTHLALKY